MKKLYNIIYLSKGEEGMLFFEHSWLVELEQSEEAVLKLLEKWNKFLENYDINGQICLGEPVNLIQAKDFTFNKILDDIKNL